jgi:signal transduction histidine kinase
MEILPPGERDGNSAAAGAWLVVCWMLQYRMPSIAQRLTPPASRRRDREVDSGPLHTRSLGVLMGVAIGVIAVLAYWDARREATSALSDFAQEQAALAQGIAAAVSSRVRAQPDAATGATADLFSDVRSVERPSSLRLLVARPGDDAFSTTDGKTIHDGELVRALAERTSWVRVDRDRAPEFGLPRRTAIAGISSFDGPSGRWGVVVAASALRERDRELRAQWRSVVGVILAAGLVLFFGGLAMRKQRKELELARELAVAELEQQREQQLLQIDKLGTMAALATGIAHEVSTPLGVIVGRAEQLLPKVATDERAKKGVESIIEHGTRISRVIRGFLNLVRGESPALERVKPAALAEAARELVEHRFEKAGVRLALDIAPDLPDVAGDPRLLEQVLINLLLNACDACERDGRVQLSARADGGHVAYVVTDDGVGITPDAAARATEPFFTTKPHGTGLGLAIATEIVKHHGGRLSIVARSSEEGHENGSPRGTRASVELPAAKNTP